MVGPASEVLVRIYIWNVSHGGATRPDDEQRIQVTGVDVPLGPPDGGIFALLGWHDEIGVLVAFDPEQHAEPSTASPSIQVSEGTLHAAAGQGIATYRRGNDESAIAFRPEFLPLYLENLDALHQTATEDEMLVFLEAATDGTGPPSEYPGAPPLLTQRRRVLSVVARAVRDDRFRRDVLAAYDDACAMCGLQGGLVEAAHIIPVSQDLGSDDVANGLALCRNHHAAYDRGLVGVAPDYSIVMSDPWLEAMAERGLDGGFDLLLDLPERIRLPRDRTCAPDPGFLAIGMDARGF